jgi:capsular exopolysaccharide synthesis family protein
VPYYKAEINFLDYLEVIRRRKKELITFCLTTVFIVTGISFLIHPVYRATVKLLIDMESPHVLTAADSIVLGNSNYYAYKEYFQSQKEIIKSRSIAKEVFKEFKLDKKEDYRNAKDPIKKFLEKVKVESVRDTRLILLHVDNEDPKLAADIANRIAQIYVARNLSYITKIEVANLLKNEYLRLQTKLSEYSKIYKYKHPKMIRLQQKIRQIEVKIKNAKRMMDTSSSMLSGLKANNVTIQDHAEVVHVPLRPNKLLNISLATIVGLFGGTALTFLFEYLDDSVKSYADVERLVKWPLLGSVPNINGVVKMTEAQKGRFVQIKPKHAIAESYRSVRTNILFSSTEEHPLKSIIITSPGPQEGKTTTLANLAISMAQSHRQVLLVDADMRKARLHEIFEGKKDIGLSSFLSGQVEFVDLIQKTAVDNLFLVSAGPNTPVPSELLSSCKIKEFIDRARIKFDFILFDTPPIGLVTDAVILSQVVDGTIVVLESGKTNVRLLLRISQTLANSQTKIIGVFVNKISLSHNDYHYYSSYYGDRSK